MLDLYILGIGGTFMGHIALLAQQLGFKVSGCDANVYSPMREMLDLNGIAYDEGYDPRFLSSSHKVYVIGNAIGRGNSMIEVILNDRRPMISGPQWLYDHVLKDKWVIAVAGTHGKTTTTSMIAWILKRLDFNPGYLIGGAAKGFAEAASLGQSEFFVIEADEYDTAFFDKRSKFIHYRPKTVILNNLEFDHADIFDSLADIKKTMHHLVRIIPSNGRVIYPAEDKNLQSVLQMGCWSEQFPVGLDQDVSKGETTSQLCLAASMLKDDASEARIRSMSGEGFGTGSTNLKWAMIGEHNLSNGLAAIAAVQHLGVNLEEAVSALATFPGVARRMELKFQFNGVSVYDDFAHHPTAIALSLAGLRARVGQTRLVAFIEPRSNTMCMGVHRDALLDAVKEADAVFWLKSPKLSFDLEELCEEKPHHHIFESAQIIFDEALKLQEKSAQEEHWLCMSNGAFGGLFEIIRQQLPE